MLFKSAVMDPHFTSLQLPKIFLLDLLCVLDVCSNPPIFIHRAMHWQYSAKTPEEKRGVGDRIFAVCLFGGCSGAEQGLAYFFLSTLSVMTVLFI